MKKMWIKAIFISLIITIMGGIIPLHKLEATETNEFVEVENGYESRAPEIEVVELSSTFTSSDEIEVFLKTNQDSVERVVISGWSGGAYSKYVTSIEAIYDEERDLYISNFQLNSIVNTNTNEVEIGSEIVYSFDAVVYGKNNTISYTVLEDVQYVENGFVTEVVTNEENEKQVNLTAEKDGYVAILAEGEEEAEKTNWQAVRAGTNIFSLARTTEEYRVLYKAGEEITSSTFSVQTYATTSAVYVTLYTDGTLGFSNNTGRISGKTVSVSYGDIGSSEYTSYSEVPWYSKRSGITTVDFVNEVRPKSTAYWFYECNYLTTVNNISNLNTSSVTNMSYMFYMSYLRSSLTSLDVSGFDTSSVTDMSFMFNECKSLTSLDVSGFDTSSVTDMRAMFYNCKSLTSLDVSGFDTSSVTDMRSMFAFCRLLTSLNVSGFDTSNVTDMRAMFYVCESLTSLNVSGFDTSSVTDMSYMFRNCSSLTSLDVSGFDTSSVTDMSYMFQECTSLTSLDVSSFDTSSVTDMNSMFHYCTSLTSIDVSNFDTRNVTCIAHMFDHCIKLTSVNLRSFDTNIMESGYGEYQMFNRCDELGILILGKDFELIGGECLMGCKVPKIITERAVISPDQIIELGWNVGDFLYYSTILYVPNRESELVYESSADYEPMGTDRIRTILSLVGEEEINIKVGETYEEEGATVAGFNSTTNADITPVEMKEYDYVLTRTGNVDITTPGKYTITYVLKLNGEEVDTATRTINVIGEISGEVKITGTNTYGEILTADTSAVTPTGCTFTYQWYTNTTNSTSGGTAIDGATSSTYQVGSELAGKYIYVEVTASKANYITETFKDITTIVLKEKLTKPTISGSYTYNGVSQTVSLTGFDANKMTVSGNTRIDAGTQTVIVSLKDTTNYQWEDDSTGELSISWVINKKALTITAKNQTVTYGTPITKTTDQISASGLVSGHSVSAITLSQSITTQGTGTITPSAATVVNGSGTAVTSNYSITYSNGTVTINKKALTITAKAQTVTYGTAITKTTGQITVSGLVSGHSVSAITLSQSITTVGTGKITPSAATVVDGSGTAVTSNYTITYNTGVLTINKKTVTITASAQTVTYGTAITKTTDKITVSGLLSGHSVSAITLSQSITTVGTGTITPSVATIKDGSGTVVTDNYSITYKTGTLTINQKALTITANAQSITYGGNITPGTGQITTSGLLSGHSVTAITLSANRSTVGEGIITPSLATVKDGSSNDVTGNYAITYNTGVLTVNKKNVVITAKDQTIIYRTEITQGINQITSSGLLSGHSVTAITLAQSRTNVGQGTITPSGARISANGTNVTDNYSITYNTGVLIINPRLILDGTLTFSDMAYTGTARESTPVLVVEGVTLIRGTDYSVAYENNVDSGMAYGTATGIGNYTGTLTSRFLIYVNKKVVDVTGLTTAAAETATATDVDTTAPDVVVGTQKDSEDNWSTTTNWSKTKDLTITATDAGTQIARIKFQSVNSFSDIFGIAVRNTNVNPVTNTRDYQFTGDITGYVTARVYLVDDVGNKTSRNLRIYNLDNKGPVITVNNKVDGKVIGNIAEVNLADAGSGLRYFAVTKSTQTTEPTNTGSTNTTTGKDLNYWYQVANNAGSNPNDTSARNINILFKTLETGTYLFWAKDLLGNVTSQQFEVDNNPLTTEWKVPAGTTIKLPIPSNSANKYIVDWGDGTFNWYTSENFPTHTYTNTLETTYTVKINGTVTHFGFNYADIEIKSTGEAADYYNASQYLVGLKSWGEVNAESYGFAQFKNLAGTIPVPTTNTFAQTKNLTYLFHKCDKLTGSIPNNFLSNANNLVGIKAMFDNCQSLTGNIPAGLFSTCTKVQDFSGIFYNCKNLTGSIPTDVFANCGEATTFKSTFFGCEKLSGAVPSSLFSASSKAKVFDWALSECKGLTGIIPEALFAQNTEAESFYKTFGASTGLTTIPANLFANNKKAKDFGGVFVDCTGLTCTIPETLFAQNTEVESLYAVFNGCTNLSGTIPENLFANTKKATNLRGIFYNCTSLTGTIPENLFANCTNATDMSAVFSECTGLSGHIPGGLLKNNTKVTTFEEIFYNCKKLQSGEIRIATNANMNVNSMFEGCEKLESVAFAENFKLLNGTAMFNGCNSLKAIIMYNNASSSSEVATLGNLDSIALPEQTVIYVPTPAAEKVYEAAWTTRYGTTIEEDELTGEMVTVNVVERRVEPILQLDGVNPTFAQKDEPYVDAGYLVAGFKVADEAKYSIYGYTVASKGLPVNTSTSGTKLVNYIISRNGVQGMDVIRQVIIMELDLGEAEILMNPTQYEYDGKVKIPKIHVKLDGTDLIENTDYKVEITNNKNAGEANVIITGIGIYQNVWQGSFKITPRKLYITPESGIVKFAGSPEPIIGYEWSNNVVGEDPKFTGELSRVGAGTTEGEATGEYAVEIGTLALQNNAGFLASNYQIVVNPEVVNVIGEIDEVFITKWSVEAGETIVLPIPRNVANNYVVTWGDRKQNTYKAEAFPSHTYTTAGEYEINIYGTCKQFGYMGDNAPTLTNTAKEYYNFTQNIIGIKQWGDIEAERFGFSHCINLTGTIPEATGFSQITTMENLFNHCTSLEGPIPENFTEEAYGMLSARNMFNNCTSLKGNIPGDLFNEKTEIRSMEGTFNNCSNLSGNIPEELFGYQEKVVSYAKTFKYCTNITGDVPEMLFASSPNVETFSETFANCIGLKAKVGDDEDVLYKYAIPQHLLTNNRTVRSYYRMFYNCRGLTGDIPEELLSSNVVIRKISNENTSYSDYRGMFEGCTGLNKVNLSLLALGKEMFKGCTGLEEIELTDTLEIGAQAFYGCNELQNIYVDDNFFSIIGTDAFEYTGTDPQLLPTHVNRENDMLVSYEWLADNRLLDVEAPVGTVEIVTEKYPFTKTQDIELKLEVTDNCSKPENCEMAIVNEDEYKVGVTYNSLQWQPFATSIEWVLSPEDDAKTVYVFFKDEAGNVCESLAYIRGRIKVISSTGTLVDNEPIELSLASSFAGNKRQGNYSFRKEYKVYREGELTEYQEYFNPFVISEEGVTYVAARLIETTSGVILDETEVMVDIDTQAPDPITIDLVRGNEYGDSSGYVGYYHDSEDSNDGVLLSVKEGTDYNKLGEEGYIYEVRYSILKDGEKLVDDELLNNNLILFDELGNYTLIVYNIDANGNQSDAVIKTINIYNL